MILAAGRGERMKPLTDLTPKPLLKVGGTPLIEHHLRRLASAGFNNIVVNASHHADQIATFCGDGSQWGLCIQISRERYLLETAGGIAQALPFLGDQPFMVINGDIYTDYPAAALADVVPRPGGAHIVLVDNPPHHSDGDFSLAEEADEGSLHGLRLITPSSREACAPLTYAGIGVFSPTMFKTLPADVYPLRPLLEQAIIEDRLTGEYYPGMWEDVGTPERLKVLNAAFDPNGRSG